MRRQVILTLIVTVGLTGLASAVPLPEPQERIDPQLFAADLQTAVKAFDRLMRGGQADWDQLITLLHRHPQRYALLINNLQPTDPAGYPGFTDYYHRKIEASEEMARQSARAWKEGFQIQPGAVISKLREPNFPSTRRIAIEYLKMENGGKELGYDWSRSPSDNNQALLFWTSWYLDKGKRQP
ncbi:MAG: hypothetical protein AB7K24_24665 [Gemmataceae bacterium]